MIDKIIEIDKQMMVFLNKAISNLIFDLIMPIITNQNFLAFFGFKIPGNLFRISKFVFIQAWIWNRAVYFI